MKKNRIDIHTHIFNLNFLPCAAAVRGYVHANTRRIKLPRWLCKLVANYYLKKTDRLNLFETLDAHEEEFSLGDIFEAEFEEMNGFSLNSFEEEITLSQEDEMEIIEFVQNEIGEMRLGELGLPEEEILSMNLTNESLVEDFLKLKTNESFVSLGVSWWVILRFLLVRLGRRFYRKTLQPFFNWFNFMTNSYESIAQKNADFYSDIGLFIHHDMDMNDWYDRWNVGRSRYEYDTGISDSGDQVSRVSQLVKDRKGKLLSFYAYNPKKGIDKLKIAIEQRGYLGVKFYPPSGYQPIDNTVPEWDKNNLELYKHCETERIPLFTHCNYGGMEAYKNANYNSDVKYWEKVLNQFPKLILCFGHAGGPDGWFSDTNEAGNKKFNDSYSGKIYRLCSSFEHVYCDFGFMPQIFHRKSYLENRLLKCYQDSANAAYPFENKIIYGSDMHMLMQEHGFEDYYAEYNSLFQRPSLEKYGQNFFRNNAISYLNLSTYIVKNSSNGFLDDEAQQYLRDLESA